MPMQIVGMDFKDAEDDQVLTAVEALEQGRGINLRCRMDMVEFSGLSKLLGEASHHLFGEEPDTFIIEYEADLLGTKITPYTGNPNEGGVLVPEHEAILGAGTITYKKELPVIIAPDPENLDGLYVKTGMQWLRLEAGGETDPTEAAEWETFCRALTDRNTRNEDRRRSEGKPVSYAPRVVSDTLFRSEGSAGPVTNAELRQPKPESTLVPVTLSQQTGQIMRTVTTAFGDAPRLRRWEIVEGQTALRHVVPKWPMQTLLSPGQALSWWGLPENTVSLQEELKQMGIESVFLVNVLTGIALKEGQVTIGMEELIRAIGRGDEARRSNRERAKVEREVWRAILFFDALTVVGKPIGRYTARDTKEVLNMTLPGREAVIKITGVVPNQVSSDGSAPPAFFSYVCGPWIVKMQGNRQILTEFGDVMRLARLPAGQPSISWAKSIGLNLNQRWRDWGHEARISRSGDANKLTARFEKEFTRRDLLLGENLCRANPDAEDILNSDKPHRAKDYWDKAIGILKERDGVNLISHYAEVGVAPTARKGWKDDWLDQPLDIRPNRESMQDIAELASARKRSRKTAAKIAK